MAIDMWSFGCILAELYTGYPLFPGENEVEQLACIMEIFDLPAQSLLSEAQRRKLFFGELATVADDLESRDGFLVSLTRRFKGKSPLHNKLKGS